MRPLVGFLGPRLFRALVALWLVSTVVFVVMRLSGDPVPLLLPPDAPHSEILRVRRELGLDKPIPVQYVVFLSNLAHGDFGRSIHFRQPAFDVVRGYLPATIELGPTAFGPAGSTPASPRATWCAATCRPRSSWASPPSCSRWWSRCRSGSSPRCDATR